MEEIPLPTTNQDVLLSIIRKGFNTVSQTTNQPVSEIHSLSLQTKDMEQPSIKLDVKPIKNGKIEKLEISLSNYSPPSFETLNALFETYGSMAYIDFEVNKSKEERDEERKRSDRKNWIIDKKYGIHICAFRWAPQNGGYIPEFISENDAHDFCKFLDILGVSYKRTGNLLKVKPSQ